MRQDAAHCGRQRTYATVKPATLVAGELLTALYSTVVPCGGLNAMNSGLATRLRFAPFAPFL